MDVDTFLETVRRYTNATEITMGTRKGVAVSYSPKQIAI